MHVIGGAGQSVEFVVSHLSAHADRVMHHHDDHDDSNSDVAGESATHVDDSQESYKHISDIDLSCGISFLLPAISLSSLPAIDRIAPALRPDTFSDRTTLPLLRPPRAFA